MSHTNSKTWVAWERQEKERWDVVSVNLTRMTLIPRSEDTVPRNFSEWLDHRQSWLQDKAEEMNLKAENLQAERKANIKAGLVNGIGPAFGGKTFKSDRGAVLSQKTIWSIWYQPPEDHPLAPWPSTEEMKEEGDERNTSGYKRFPALPRVPGNETVVWKQKAMIDPYPLDQVWELPTAKSRELPSLDEAASDFLGQDLLDAIGGKDVPCDTQTKLGYDKDSDDSATLNVSTSDGSSSLSDLSLKRKRSFDDELDDSGYGDFKLRDFAPYDTSSQAIEIREQFPCQLNFKFTKDLLCAGQEVINRELCNPLQSAYQVWMTALRGIAPSVEASKRGNVPTTAWSYDISAYSK